MSTGVHAIPVCDNVFAAIDPTCQRELGTTTSGSSLHHEHPSSTKPAAVSPVVPADIHAARRRAPLGMIYSLLFLRSKNCCIAGCYDALHVAFNSYNVSHLEICFEPANMGCMLA